MSERVGRERLHKRAEALEEAAGHLDLAWTDDPVERIEGIALGNVLREWAALWRDRAHRFSGWPEAAPPIAPPPRKK